MRNPAYRVRRVLASAMLASTFSLVTPSVRSQSSDRAPLKQVADVPLPGPAVRFDYQSLDTSQGRLYIAHMNANQLVVFDTKKLVVIANLDGFPSVHGVWAIPELGRVYASVTGDHKVAAVDMAALKTIAKVGPINYPDGIAYAPDSKRGFVSDEHGGADAVIDTKTNSLVTSFRWAAVLVIRSTTPAPGTSWLRFTKRTNSSRLILQQPKSSGAMR